MMNTHFLQGYKNAIQTEGWIGRYFIKVLLSRHIKDVFYSKESFNPFNNHTRDNS